MPLGVRIGAIMPALCSDVAIMPTQFFGCDYAEIMPGIRGWTQHAPREDWDNPMTAGALARWILWDKETLPSSIEDYTRRFNLAAV